MPSDVTGPPLLLGVDVGGTGTRALLVPADGSRTDPATAPPVGRAHGPSGNPVSGSVPAAVAVWEAVVTEALGDHDPGRVAATVIGAAGSLASGPELRAGADAMAGRLGLRHRPRLVPDVVTAFTGGTDGDTGLVLLVGTGAVAGRIRRDTLTERVDGHGWLLGDDGSGVWLGRRAVRAALSALEGGASTALLADVAAALGARESVDAIVSAVYARPPRDLAALAPLVGAAAPRDRVAAALLDAAAAAALDRLAQLSPATGEVVVLAGGVATSEAMLRDRLTEGLTARWGRSAPLCTTPVTGAVRIAARMVSSGPKGT